MSEDEYREFMGIVDNDEDEDRFQSITDLPPDDFAEVVREIQEQVKREKEEKD
ncbi:hypothetical protein [Natrinema caseinilyticum]|uniref:hypothetical protein n=1 Tax=Natrinema caseinilyticum TaxID=2961570 RepID=UPI0020C459A2|nr:hypothetical protein [Natrinema caseinilyticum]